MIVYGKNVAEEYLKNSEDIKKIYLEEGFKDNKLISLIEKSNIKPIILNKKDFNHLASGVNQGIILEVKEYLYKDIDDIIKDNGFIVILDHIEDPHNLGAIIRTCEAAGVDGIVITKDRCAEVNGTVLKTSAGAIKNIDVVQVTNLVSTIKYLKDKGYWIYGTSLDNSNDFRTADYSGNVAIIIGNEGSGISRLVKETCDFMINIPMYGKVNSLNASVSTGIIVYEVLRQKKK